MNEMFIYELIMEGFDGTSDKTDDFIKWVKAPNVETVMAFACSIGLKNYSVEKLANQQADTFEDGLDVVINTKLEVVEAAKDVNVKNWKHQRPLP